MILYGQRSKKVIINESQVSILEDVFVNNLDKKRKKAKLKYDKRTNFGRIRNKGNIMPLDIINTSKMDKDDADTFVVPLKGGINSYNITSIRGDEVMHYFKRYFSKQTSDITVLDNGKKERYELEMEDDEFSSFMNQFYQKVSNVIDHAIEGFKKDGKNDFHEVVIYPIPSSSNFNVEMADRLAHLYSYNGLPIRVIDKSIFTKDLKNLEKDQEFIDKNKKYYSTKKFILNNVDKSTHEETVDNQLERLKSVRNAQNLIAEYNNILTRVLRIRQVNFSKYKDKGAERLAEEYLKLNDVIKRINDSLKLGSGSIHRDSAMKQLRRSKNASIEARSNDIWNIVKPLLRGKGITRIYLEYLEPNMFEIKTLSNDVRMGLKGYYTMNHEKAREEIQDTKNTIFVIFDDNMAVGATMSDICVQLKEWGAEYIVPITFGKILNKRWSISTSPITMPSSDGTFEAY